MNATEIAVITSERGPYGRKEDWPGRAGGKSERTNRKRLHSDVEANDVSLSSYSHTSAVHHPGRQQWTANVKTGKRIFHEHIKGPLRRRSADQTYSCCTFFFFHFANFNITLLPSTVFDYFFSFLSSSSKAHFLFLFILFPQLEHDLLLRLHHQSHNYCTFSLLTLIWHFCQTICKLFSFPFFFNFIFSIHSRK